MRLNRGTMGLLLASVVVIIAITVFNATEEDTAPPPATPAETSGGPIFPDLDESTIIRIEMGAAESGDSVTIEKNGEDGWAITGATSSTERETDQLLVAEAVGTFAGLSAVDSFPPPDAIADFGLAEPAFTLSMIDDSGAAHTVRVGNQNPSGNRYYTLVNEDNTMVHLLPRSTIENLTNLIADPPYVPPPTATPTASPTLDDEAAAAPDEAAADETGGVTEAPDDEPTVESRENTAQAADESEPPDVTATPTATPVPSATPQATREVGLFDTPPTTPTGESP